MGCRGRPCIKGAEMSLRGDKVTLWQSYGQFSRGRDAALSHSVLPTRLFKAFAGASDEVIWDYKSRERA